MFNKCTSAADWLHYARPACLLGPEWPRHGRHAAMKHPLRQRLKRYFCLFNKKAASISQWCGLITSSCVPCYWCQRASLVLSHSCLSIHASHIANVRMLSISLNVVLSVFHDLFTHLNPPRTSIFNRGGSHGFPWPQNGYGVHAQHAQCANAYFSAVSAVVSAHGALLELNLESSDSTSYMYNLDFGCFVEGKLSKNFSRSGLVFLKGLNWAVTLFCFT